MTLRERFRSISSLRFTPEERSLLNVQLPLVWALSVALVLGYGLQHELRFVAERHHLRVLFRGWDGLAWFVWPLAAPLMLMMIRRFPLSPGRIRRNLVRLAVASAALYLVVTNARMLLRILPELVLASSDGPPIDFQEYLVSMLVLLPLDLLSFCGFFFLSFAINYYFMHRERKHEALQLKLRTAQLESDLAQAELKALRGQLHPHFLFNSFNAVTTLMRQKRNEAAVEVVAQLGALLRLAIDRTGQQELNLESEIDFIRRYLDIERIRFGDKLRLDYQVEPAALTGRVPNLLLQPLVENAIKHGISRRTQPGTVRILARRTGARVEIEIENDGPDEGAPARGSQERVGGVGLSNTRSRLEKIYGDEYSLAMIRRADGGMRVRVELPWRPSQSLR